MNHTTQTVQRKLGIALWAIMIMTAISSPLRGEIYDKDGNIGIGTSDPKYRLSVANGMLNVEKNGDYYGFWVENKSRSDNPKINLGEWYNSRGGISYDTSGDFLALETQKSSTTYANTLVLWNGKVGVNTSSPDNTLDINGVVRVRSSYYGILNYSYNGNAQHGVKIKTNIPFGNDKGMPTIIIEGYAYPKETMGIILNWYTYKDAFYYPHASSYGSFTPSIKLGREDGKVVIFMESGYFHRFTVRAFGQNLNENPEWFNGWTAQDAPLTGDKIAEVSYYNKFKDKVAVLGSVGIGTETPSEALTVVGNGLFEGTVYAQDLIVDPDTWADYVFEENYSLRPLNEVEQFIQTHKHLPEIPSEQEVMDNGVSVRDMQVKLLQKVEELTLYLIEQDKRIHALESAIESN